MLGSIGAIQPPQIAAKFQTCTLQGQQSIVGYGLNISPEISTAETLGLPAKVGVGLKLSPAFETQRIDTVKPAVKTSFKIYPQPEAALLSGLPAVAGFGYGAQADKEERQTEALRGAVNTSFQLLASGMIATLVGLQPQLEKRQAQPGKAAPGRYSLYIVCVADDDITPQVRRDCATQKSFDEMPIKNGVEILFTIEADSKAWLYKQPWSGKVKAVYNDTTHNTLLKYITDGG